MRVLVVNAGSSSLKLARLDVDGAVTAHRYSEYGRAVPARPGDVLILEGTCDSFGEDTAVVSGRVTVDGETILEATDVMCALIDASDLAGIGDDSFDLVVSIFGAMFAPKPFDVAKEMVRVTRPGGRIVMGNWIPNDPTLVAQILKISSAFTPPPPQGFVSPMTWGVEDNVIERFTAAGIPEERISFEKDTYTFSYPGPPSELVATFRSYYGPTMNAFDAAEKNGRAADLQNELEALFNSQNTSPDATSIPATFLRVTVSA